MRDFTPTIADLVRAIVSTLPPTWPVQNILARIKTNFVDMRELGEMLEDIELDLITIKVLDDLDDDLKNKTATSTEGQSPCSGKNVLL